MDIFEQIRKEHRDVEGMLQELSRGFDKPLFKGLRLALTAHLSAEEASLYPAITDREREMAMRNQRAHDGIRNSLRKFGLGEPVDFPSKLSELAEVVRAHFREEEEMLLKTKGMFDQEKIGELSYLFYETERRIIERAK